MDGAIMSLALLKTTLILIALNLVAMYFGII